MLNYEDVSKMLRCDFDSGSIFWIEDSYSGFKKSVLRHAQGDEAGTKRNDGRFIVNLNGKLYLRYRVVWLLYYKKLPNGSIDHINGNPSDDSIINLRDATPDINSQNIFRCHKNKKSSKYLGVFMDKRKKNKKWRSSIMVNGENISLGYFLTEKEAYEVYMCAKSNLHKGYVESNFQDIKCHN